MSDEARVHSTVQTAFPPLETLEAVADHVAALRQTLQWDQCGVLFDEGPTGILIVLVQDRRVVAVFRFCLSATESVAAAEAAAARGGTVLAGWQGQVFTSEQLVDLDALSRIWDLCEAQRTAATTSELREFFAKVEDGSRDRGRGEDISDAIRRVVWFDAHGRCIFSGCGHDLTKDDVTGESGNFGYLAHNVSSAEAGPRAIPVLSGKLSNDPKNILLLCDTHHRLIDAVARADYPAHVLSEMRANFCRAASELLDALSMPPVPVYCLSWPVHQQTISIPSSLQIAQSLAPIGVRIDGRPHHLSDNETALRSADSGVLWALLASQVNTASERLLMQLHDKSYRAALFAMGLMPALIAFGAKLGNKCDITPMLRHRESNIWFWPASNPRGQFWEVRGRDSIKGPQREITISIALTAEPESMKRGAAELGHPRIQVRAKQEFLGNGALAHPTDGFQFRQRMQELMHDLHDTHGAEVIHVLPCASNAACVFFGQAFDSHHPEWLVYDFKDDSMVPRLRVRNEDNACVVTSAETAVQD